MIILTDVLDFNANVDIYLCFSVLKSYVSFLHVYHHIRLAWRGVQSSLYFSEVIHFWNSSELLDP